MQLTPLAQATAGCIRSPLWIASRRNMQAQVGSHTVVRAWRGSHTCDISSRHCQLPMLLPQVPMANCLAGVQCPPRSAECCSCLSVVSLLRQRSAQCPCPPPSNLRFCSWVAMQASAAAGWSLTREAGSRGVQPCNTKYSSEVYWF